MLASLFVGNALSQSAAARANSTFALVRIDTNNPVSSVAFYYGITEDRIIYQGRFLAVEDWSKWFHQTDQSVADFLCVLSSPVRLDAGLSLVHVRIGTQTNTLLLVTNITLNITR